MADYISNVLNVLRLLKPGPGETTWQHIQRWCGEGFTEAMGARVCAYVLESVEGAEALIRAGAMPSEATDGLFQTTQALRRAFSPTGVQGQIQANLPALDGSLAMFAIFASKHAAPAEPPKEALNLVAEIDAMIQRLQTDELDPLVQEIAVRHLRILAIVLRYVQAFGVDAGMLAYSELIVRLRRAENAATEDTKKKMRAIWPTIKTWLGHLGDLDRVLNASQDLLEHGQDGLALLADFADA